MSEGSSGLLPRGIFRALVHPWTWRMAWRDSRSQRLRLLVFSMAIVSGIAALTAIHSLKASVERGIAAEAKSLLGSDLRVSSRNKISEADIDQLAGKSTRWSQEVSFPSMMRFPRNGGARLMQVRAITSGFPFYGEVETRPKEAWEKLDEVGGVLLEPAILDQFSVQVGDEVQLGGVNFPIIGVVAKPAPRGGRFSGFAPEAYIRFSDLESTGLLGKNSMANYQVHLKIPGSRSGEALKEEVRNEFDNSRWRLETPEDRQENLGKALDRFQEFLGIIALASLALGAIGVAGAVQSHINRRIQTVATLLCLGCPVNLAFAIYLVQAVLLGLCGAIIGAGLGIGMQVGLLAALGEELPVSVEPSPEWLVSLKTTVMGFAVCCGFALVPLFRIRGISPSITLRSGSSLPGRGWRGFPVYLLVAGLMIMVARSNDPNWVKAMAMVGGLAVAFLVLAGVAKGLTLMTRKIVANRTPYLLRQGLSNLHRPGNQTLLFLLSLGLGTFLLVTILSVAKLLNNRLDLQAAEETPNLYLIDVQPDQEEGVRRLVGDQALPVLESTPMVTMRIESIRGVPIGDLKDVPRWVGRREYRSTYRDHLIFTEELLEGELSKERYGLEDVVPISLEEKIASDMKVGLGDEIVMDVQGIPVVTRVGSIRRVDWSKFNLNFFMVFPPGVLEEAPGFHVVTTRTPDPESSGKLQRELAEEFANVTAIDLTLILESIRDILSKISLVVSLLGGFTLLAGLPILLGTLLNGRDVRLKESVLLRTLGASSSQVRAILVIEYFALGLLAALTGVSLAVIANGALAIFLFEAPPWPDWSLVGTALGVVIAVSVSGGLALSRGVCHHPPLEILRGGS